MIIQWGIGNSGGPVFDFDNTGIAELVPTTGGFDGAIISPKIFIDSVLQTSTVDLFVFSLFIATYRFSGGMFTLMELPNNVFLNKLMVNTNYLAKDGWIRAMVKADFPAEKLRNIIAIPPNARPLNVSKDIHFTESYLETDTVFKGVMSIDSDTFTAIYDKATGVTKIFAHPEWHWTPEEFGLWWGFIIRFVDRVNMD